MDINRAILATLTYHSIFQYPLTKHEIKKFLISRTCTNLEIDKSLKVLLGSKKINQKNGFYYFGSNKYTGTRKFREIYAKYKKMRAHIYAGVLRTIPWVKMVAITGALAMNNSTKDDDIDLLIVTSKGRLWTTRFFANLLLLPLKRSPKSKKQKDKACLNIFLDESDLKVSDQNIYTAHEIAQMKVIYDSDNTYFKLLKANKWIKRFLPNWLPEHIESQKIKIPTANSTAYFLVDKLEEVLKNFQLNYMKGKVTSEKITGTQLFFHPKSTQRQVLVSYQRKIQLLTDI